MPAAKVLQFPFSAYTFYASCRPNWKNTTRKKKREREKIGDKSDLSGLSVSSELGVGRVIPAQAPCMQEAVAQVG